MATQHRATATRYAWGYEVSIHRIRVNGAFIVGRGDTRADAAFNARLKLAEHLRVSATSLTLVLVGDD